MGVRISLSSRDVRDLGDPYASTCDPWCSGEREITIDPNTFTIQQSSLPVMNVSESLRVLDMVGLLRGKHEIIAEAFQILYNSTSIALQNRSVLDQYLSLQSNLKHGWFTRKFANHI